MSDKKDNRITYLAVEDRELVCPTCKKTGRVFRGRTAYGLLRYAEDDETGEPIPVALPVCRECYEAAGK